MTTKSLIKQQHGNKASLVIYGVRINFWLFILGQIHTRHFSDKGTRLASLVLHKAVLNVPTFILMSCNNSIPKLAIHSFLKKLELILFNRKYIYSNSYVTTSAIMKLGHLESEVSTFNKEASTNKNYSTI